MKGSAVVSVLAGLALLARNAAAQSDDKVYVWETAPRAWAEVQMLNAWVVDSKAPYERFGGADRRRGLHQHYLELAYGVTDNWAVGAYGDFEGSPDGPFRYTGVRLESNYRLFARYERLVEAGLHAELRVPRGSSGSPQELEALVILQRDLGDFRLIANPGVELALSGDEVTQGLGLRVAAGLYWRRFWLLQPAVEYFGAFGPFADLLPADEQRHVIYPGVRWRIVPGVDWLLSAGIGLNRASDRWLLRGILSYEFETIRPSDQAF